jgi:hypothetical protein
MTSTRLNILLTKHYKLMGRPRMKTCVVSGIKTKADNFYTNQNHVKAVDNLRRVGGATKEQLTRMFNQINNY